MQCHNCIETGSLFLRELFLWRIRLCMGMEPAHGEDAIGIVLNRDIAWIMPSLTEGRH